MLRGSSLIVGCLLITIINGLPAPQQKASESPGDKNHSN